MAEFKVGDLVEIIATDWTDLGKGTFCKVIEVANCPCRFKYKVRSVGGGKSDWVDSGSIQSLAGVRSEPEQLDLYTVQHICDYYAGVIHEATKAEKSHEAVNIALLGYLKGLKVGLSNA